MESTELVMFYDQRPFDLASLNREEPEHAAGPGACPITEALTAGNTGIA